MVRPRKPPFVVCLGFNHLIFQIWLGGDDSVWLVEYKNSEHYMAKLQLPSNLQINI